MILARHQYALLLDCGAAPHTRVEEPEQKIINSRLTGAPVTDKCLLRTVRSELLRL